MAKQVEIRNNFVVQILGFVLDLLTPKADDGSPLFFFEGIPIPRKATNGDPSTDSKVRVGKDADTLLVTAGGSTGQSLYDAMIDAAGKYLRAIIALGNGDDLPGGGKLGDDLRNRAKAAFRNVLITQSISEADFVAECDAFILAAQEGRGATFVKVIPEPEIGYTFNLQISNEENVAAVINRFPDMLAAEKVEGKTVTKPFGDFYAMWRADVAAKKAVKDAAEKEARVEAQIKKLKSLGATAEEILSKLTA